MIEGLTNFQAIYTEIANRARIPVPTIAPGSSGEIIKVKRIINQVYTDLDTEGEDWWWLTKVGRLQLVDEVESGTVNVTSGSTTVTGTGTTWVTDGVAAGDKFYTLTFDEVYTIASVTSETTLTLESPGFQGSTAAAQSYRIVRDTYTLPSDFARPIYLQRFFLTLPLEGVGIREFRQMQLAFPKIIGTPEIFTIHGTTAAGVRQIQFWPPSDKNMTLEFEYKRTIPQLDLDTDVPLLPLSYRDYLVERSLESIYRDYRSDETTAQAHQIVADRRLDQMKGENRHQKASVDLPKLAPNLVGYRDVNVSPARFDLGDLFTRGIFGSRRRRLR